MIALRNAAWPERAPAGGLDVVRDGETAEEGAVLSPVAYGMAHRTDVEVSSDNEVANGAIIAALAAAIAADHTLGGAMEWAEVGSANFDTTAPDGAISVATALVPLRVMFTVLGVPAS